MRIHPRDLDTRALYQLMISAVVPRPIAWVSTRSAEGVLNAAPFSYFQALSSSPPTIMISVGKRREGAPKDTRANIEETGEFVVNVVSEPSAQRMVRTADAFPPDVSEFEAVGLTAEPSELVTPPRIQECAVAMECRLERRFDIGNSAVLVGEVLLFHVRDDVALPDGTIDPTKLAPLGRLGGRTYAPLREVLEVTGDGAVAVASETLALWQELRASTIAMARRFTVQQLARGERETVGRLLRHVAACTHYRVLTWTGREDEDTHRAWDLSWTGERLAAELEADRDQFLEHARSRWPSCAHEVRRMTRHEAWHQGQIAAVLGDDFESGELWKL